MPVCCEPGARYPIVLDGDKGKDPAPTFWCRHLSARKFRRMTEAAAQMSESSSLEKQLDLLEESLTAVVCDWSNMIDADGSEMPFDAGSILEVLTIEEAAELLSKATAGQRVSGADSKKSGSPSLSGSDNTAAAACPAPAETAQPQQAR